MIGTNEFPQQLIGKTRTAQELMGFAGRMGAHVLWGRCYEGEGAPSYWPWVQILRASLEDADQERIWVDMGQAAADMATMLPAGEQPEIPLVVS